MAAVDLSSLLILQDRDARCEQIRRQIEQFPRERAHAEGEVAALGSRKEAAHAAFRDMEVKRKGLEGSVADAEEKIRRYRTQQISVKKTDEYEALNHEIAALEARIDETETEELELLESIDAARAELAATDAEIAEKTSLFQSEIARLEEALGHARSELEAAEAAVTEAEAKVDAALLAQYAAIKRQVKRPPWVVPIRDSRCTGCHIKVSGEVESEARRHHAPRCDSCGRLVYWER